MKIFLSNICQKAMIFGNHMHIIIFHKIHTSFTRVELISYYRCSLYTNIELIGKYGEKKFDSATSSSVSLLSSYSWLLYDQNKLLLVKAREGHLVGNQIN